MSFESVFFGAGNDISWEDIQNGGFPANVRGSLQPFLDSLHSKADVAILPRRIASQSVFWYILCRSPRASRSARDELRGFLGATFCKSFHDTSRLSGNDPIDAAVLQQYGPNAFRLEIPYSHRDRARIRLTEYLALRTERPNRLTLLIRTVGQVLRDYEYALLAGCAADAFSRIEELRAGGYLSATNTLFLEIRAFAANRDWPAILEHPDLRSLLAIQRPLRVTEALVKAVYNAKLKRFEAANDAQGAFVAFQPIYSNFSDIYRFRGKMEGPEVEASFLLTAALNNSQDPAASASILREAENRESTNLEYFRKLHELIPSAASPVQSGLQSTQIAFALGDIERAAEMALSLTGSYERTALLLRCARELETLESAQVALDSFGTLPRADQDRITNNVLLSKIAAQFNELALGRTDLHLERGLSPLPTDWEGWFEGLSQERPWTGALEAAKRGSREWDLEALSSDPSRLRRLSDLILEDRAYWARTAFRDSLPHLIEFFQLSEPDTRLRGVYDAIFLSVSVDEDISTNQLLILDRLADMRLTLGTSVAEYSSIADELRATIYRLDSPAVIEGALEACEVLVSHPCGLSEGRLAVFAATSATLLKWHRRVNSAQLSLFSVLCDELGTIVARSIAIPEIQPEQDNQWRRLAGLKIALYSLQEGAVRRAALLLEELTGHSKVDTFSDHVGGSPALRTAAQQSDVFVITTAAAKHSATTFIESKRPKGSITLYANGQGTTSILQTIARYLAASA